MRSFENLKIAVAGTGYVGLSLAVLQAQHHQVTAVDVVPEKVDLFIHKENHVEDEYITRYLLKKTLELRATLNEEEAYNVADFVIFAVPTNYDSQVI